MIPFLPLCSKLCAQNTEEDIIKKGYIDDAIINIIIDHLPNGWKFKNEKGCFIIQRQDSIWELSENTLNVPIEKREDKIKRIQANGKKTVSEIIIKFEDKWDFLKVQEATINNTSVSNDIRLLPDKYKITGLKDASLSSKEKVVYTPKTDEEKNRISNYNAELKQLKEKIIKIPDMSSQKYSLFVIAKNGCNDDNHIVYPDAASVELYTVMALFREVCGK